MYNPRNSVTFFSVVALVSQQTNLSVKASLLYCNCFITSVPIKQIRSRDTSFIAHKIINSMNCNLIDTSNLVFTQELTSHDIKVIHSLKRIHQRHVRSKFKEEIYSKLGFNYKN